MLSLNFILRTKKIICKQNQILEEKVSLLTSLKLNLT